MTVRITGMATGAKAEVGEDKVTVAWYTPGGRLPGVKMTGTLDGVVPLNVPNEIQPGWLAATDAVYESAVPVLPAWMLIGAGLATAV